MNEKQILLKFAEQFVKNTFKDRFFHEALRKPKALHHRICHQILNVFDEVYEGNSIQFNDDEKCLFLSWGGPIYLTTWKDAKEIMSTGGGGHLVIKVDSSGFYAETEGYPAQIYSGRV